MTETTKDNSRLNCMMNKRRKIKLKQLAHRFNKNTITGLLIGIADEKILLVDKESFKNLTKILRISTTKSKK